MSGRCLLNSIKALVLFVVFDCSCLCSFTRGLGQHTDQTLQCSVTRLTVRGIVKRCNWIWAIQWNPINYNSSKTEAQVSLNFEKLAINESQADQLCALFFNCCQQSIKFLLTSVLSKLVLYLKGVKIKARRSSVVSVSFIKSNG